MALVVEDGTGVSGANTYASLTDVNEYHSSRGNSSWSEGDAYQINEIVFGDVSPAAPYKYTAVIDDVEYSVTVDEVSVLATWESVLSELSSVIEAGTSLDAAYDTSSKTLTLQHSEINTSFDLSSVTVTDTGIEVVGATPSNEYATPTTEAGSDSVKEEAILRAMDYMETLPWKGRKYDYDNSLEWPRSGVIDRNGYAVETNSIPAAVVRSLKEAALFELASPGTLLPSLDRGGQLIRQKIDVIEFEWSDGAPIGTVRHKILDPLRGLLADKNNIALLRG